MARLIALSLLKSLGLTLLLELGFGAVLGLRKWKDFLLVALVNVLTNPVLGLILDAFWLHSGAVPPWYLIAGLELLVIGTEGLLYRGRLEAWKWNPFLLSILLNGLSYLGGLILT